MVSGGERGSPITRSDAAVSYRGVTYSYDGNREALSNITLDVAEGERLGVLGPNGGGKSTLLKLTLGLLPLQRGELTVFGLPPREARQRGLIGYVPQRIEAELRFPLSVRQVIEMASGVDKRGAARLTADQKRHAAEAMEAVGITDLADRPIGQLSGGQLQRVMIARALSIRPRMLLLDEPMVGVDVAGQRRFADLLKGLHESFGLTMLIVSHDLRAIASGCDRVACLSRTLHSHTAPEGLTPQVLAEVFRHDVAGIFGDVHIDAHAAAECTDPSHVHSHTHPPAGPVSLTVRGRKNADGGGDSGGSGGRA